MSLSVLVTGGAGYVGSTLCHLLLDRGHRVSTIDNLSFGGEALLGLRHRDRFSFHHGDITDHDVVSELLEDGRFDAVVHLAAIVGDPACAQQPELATAVNRDASEHLLTEARKYGVHRFIFASTCSNYGRMAEGAGYVDETSPLAPISLYAELKVGFEQRLIATNASHETFCPTAIRCATVHGLSPRMRFDLTVNEFTRDLARGEELEIFGPQFWRPYCHVRDIARAIELILTSEPELVAGEVFNVGDTGENYTKQMLVDEILKVIPDGRITYVERKEDPRDYRVNFDKIRKVLGFEISMTVPESIAAIHQALHQGLISEPFNQRYGNV